MTTDKEIANMSPDELESFIALLQEEADPDWQEKIRATFHTLQNHRQLEAMGKAMTYYQVMAVLDAIRPRGHHPKLSPILVGLKSQEFTKLILSATDFQMEILKHETVAEPILHQLTALFQSMSAEETQFTQNLGDLKSQIHSLNISSLTNSQLDELYGDLQQASEQIDNAIRKIDRALELAWNTNRPTLVDNLTELKEHYHNDSRVGLGHPSSSETASSGLYAALEKRLFDVYGNIDEEPSREALAKLSVWYLKDYLALGLVPNIGEEEKRALLSVSEEDSATNKRREDLRQQAMSTLSSLGLRTVKDFKNARIFSKPTLIEFIQRNAATKT